MSPYPILYSFRRCPYAMRARLAIACSGLKTELREVVLKDKPQQLLALSPKATVPVLQTGDGTIIEESLDIMDWALSQSDPDGWLSSLSKQEQQQSRQLIADNDGEFKYYLDRYKYADRYPQYSQAYYREQAEQFLQQLETLLQTNGKLFKQHLTVADIAILPFIRQFSMVEPGWFADCPYPLVTKWLEQFTASALFSSIMAKYPQWQPQQQLILFP